MQMLWDVTNTCNQRCRHCYNSRFINQRHCPDSPWNDVVHERFRRFIALNDVHLVTLAGGEPFTRTDIFQVIDALAGDAGVAVTTNATLISGSVAKQIARSPLAKVAVSLESADAAAYDWNRGGVFFERFRAGLARLSDARRNGSGRFWLELSVTILPWCLKDEPDVTAVYELGRQTGCDSICYQFANSAGVGWEYLADARYVAHIAGVIARLSRHYLDIVTTLQYKRCLVDYCNACFSADLLGGKTLCPAGTEVVYMDNQLRLFPCIYHNGGPQDKLRIAAALGWDEQDDANHLRNIERLDRCPLFVRFDQLKRKIAGTAYRACRTCPNDSRCYKVCPYDYILNRKVAVRNLAGVCELIRPAMDANAASPVEAEQAGQRASRAENPESTCP